MAKPNENYNLNVKNANIDRLALLNEHYNPSSRTLLESIGLDTSSTIIDVKCGHSAITRWMTKRVKTAGHVHAIDKSADQLVLARKRVGELPQVRFTYASIEELSLT